MLIVGQFLLDVVLIKSCIIVKIDLSVRTDDDKKWTVISLKTC